MAMLVYWSVIVEIPWSLFRTSHPPTVNYGVILQEIKQQPPTLSRHRSGTSSKKCDTLGRVKNTLGGVLNLEGLLCYIISNDRIRNIHHRT